MARTNTKIYRQNRYRLGTGFLQASLRVKKAPSASESINTLTPKSLPSVQKIVTGLTGFFSGELR